MRSSRPELVVDWCSHEAAKYAVEHWHYMGAMPKGKLAKVGVWEEGHFIGTVIFSYGATPQIGSPYGLTQYEICELARVAMREHRAAVSKVIGRSVGKLRRQAPGLRLIVSFADTEQGHLGIIYQASNWIYAGTTKAGRVGFVVDGKKIHTRTIGHQPGGVQSLEWVRQNLDPLATEWHGTPKHRYLYPLDRAMRRQIAPLAKPYPKRGPGVQGDTSGVQPEGPGSSPGVRS